MRIKKVSKTTGISAEVIDGYDESSSNAYSCNYINNKTDYKITTGTEFATNEYLDGKRVYVKVLEFNDLIGAGINDRLVKPHGITGASLVWLDLSDCWIKASNNVVYPLPLVTYSGNVDIIEPFCNLTNIYMEAQTAWNTAWTKHIRLKYVK